MGSVRSSEPSVTIYHRAWRNIPEDPDILSTDVRSSNLAASFLFGSAIHKVSYTTEDGKTLGEFLDQMREYELL